MFMTSSVVFITIEGEYYVTQSAITSPVIVVVKHKVDYLRMQLTACDRFQQ